VLNEDRKNWYLFLNYVFSVLCAGSGLAKGYLPSKESY
jgi:hypothetical protein